MSQRVLLIQSDAAGANSIIGALSNCSDQPFHVEWVRRCSEGLTRLDGVEAILSSGAFEG